jgi:hypothetical protein
MLYNFEVLIQWSCRGLQVDCFLIMCVCVCEREREREREMENFHYLKSRLSNLGQLSNLCFWKLGPKCCPPFMVWNNGGR